MWKLDKSMSTINHKYYDYKDLVVFKPMRSDNYIIFKKWNKVHYSLISKYQNIYYKIR